MKTRVLVLTSCLSSSALLPGFPRQWSGLPTPGSQTGIRAPPTARWALGVTPRSLSLSDICHWAALVCKPGRGGHHFTILRDHVAELQFFYTSDAVFSLFYNFLLLGILIQPINLCDECLMETNCTQNWIWNTDVYALVKPAWQGSILPLSSAALCGSVAGYFRRSNCPRGDREAFSLRENKQTGKALSHWTL